jgi:hypothetical protein
MGFKGINGIEINNILENFGRQYLVGNLGRPQKLEHIQNDKIEIGITYYDKFTNENPHWHPQQDEYQLMLEGETIYTDSLSKEKYTYKKDDFYYIEPFTCYLQESKAGTKILFIKIPTVNDKTVCRYCDKNNCLSRIDKFVEYKEYSLEEKKKIK